MIAPGMSCTATPGWRSSGGRPGCWSTVPLVEPRSVTTADPWSAPAPGRISRWVEEISWWGLGTVTSRGCSVDGEAARLGRAADDHRAVDVDDLAAGERQPRDRARRARSAPAAGRGCPAGCGRSRRGPSCRPGSGRRARRRPAAGSRGASPVASPVVARVGGRLDGLDRRGCGLGLGSAGVGAAGPGCSAVSSITLTSGADVVGRDDLEVGGCGRLGRRTAGRSVRATRTRPSRISRSSPAAVGDLDAHRAHAGQRPLGPGGRRGALDRHGAVVGGELGVRGAADDHLGLGARLAHQDEPGQLAQPVGDQRVEDLVETRAVVDQRPDPRRRGTSRTAAARRWPGRRRCRTSRRAGRTGSPVGGRLIDRRGLLAGHGRAPNFSSRLTRCRSES